MANIQARDVAEAVRAVLQKHDGKSKQISKVQARVLRKLSKEHGGLDEAHVGELLQQLLTSSREFYCDGRKVSLQQPAAAPRPAAAAAAAAATAAAASQPEQQQQQQQQQQQKEKKKKGKHKHKKAAALAPAPGECGWLVERAATVHKRDAITAVAAALPQRTRQAVWQFLRGNYTPTEGKWSAAEDAQLLALHAELGPTWTEIGSRLGRLGQAAKDRARNLNYGKPFNTGKWSDEEVDLLQSLVHSYRQALEQQTGADGPRTIHSNMLPSGASEARPVAVMTLGNISWTSVACQMGTRTSKQCRKKWHLSLATSNIESGHWGRDDDKRLIAALAAAAAATGALESHQVDWAALVAGHSAAQCQRRWLLLLRNLPVETRCCFPAAVAEAAARVQQSEEAVLAAAGAAAAGKACGAGAAQQKKRKRQAANSSDEQQQEQPDEDEEACEAAPAAAGGGQKKR
ncbi:hypothetical protein OEZ86_000071 [Tetradesmus obliquus]|nr:hypothetical protein OEZ86_000071 [Tetradesmus obliquus]